MEFNQNEPVTEEVINALKNASFMTFVEEEKITISKNEYKDLLAAKGKAIKSLITFAKKAYDLYGEELEMNLMERATGNEYREEMKKYEQGKEELFDIVYSITKE